jgi:hypothetical protein
MYAWAEDHPNGNLGLRLPDNVIGIDIDNYGNKKGAAILAEAEKRWGTLPSTWISSARDFIPNGTRLYRIPEGYRAIDRITFPDKNLHDGIDIIQHEHRYMVVAPSVHPDLARQYQWVDTSGLVTDELPSPATLPELPRMWLEGLKILGPGRERADIDLRKALQDMQFSSNGHIAPELIERTEAAALALYEPNAKRHEIVRAAILSIVSEAQKAGLPGALESLNTLQGLYVQAKADPRFGRTTPEDVVRNDFRRMLKGAIEIVEAERSDGLEHLFHTEHVEVTAEKVSKTDEYSGLTKNEDDEFWSARSSLMTIREWAAHKLISPWALLGAASAHVITCVPTGIDIPGLTGRPVSLNFFLSMVGASGAGKGSASGTAGLMLDTFDPSDVGGLKRYITRELGTGEGLQQAYFDRVPVKQPGKRGRPEIQNVFRTPGRILFHVSEIGSYEQQVNRKGNTLPHVLAQAFMGDQIDPSYAGVDKYRALEKLSYRACLIMEVQPGMSRVLFGQSDSGLPQRFLWMPAHYSFDLERVDNQPGVIEIPMGHEFVGAANIEVPQEVREQLFTERRNAMRGINLEALDGHANLVQIKLAYSLAVMDGRTTGFTMEDWALAKVVMRVSKHVRGWTEKQLLISEAKEAARQGDLDGVRKAATGTVLSEANTKRIAATLCRYAVRAHKASDDAPLTLSALKRYLSSKDKEAANTAFEFALNTGYFEPTNSEAPQGVPTAKAIAFDWETKKGQRGNFPSDWA